MRRILSYLTLILALLLAATSCVVDLTPQMEPLTPLARELGLDEPEIPVCIGFQLPFEEPALPATKGSIVSGEEDPEDYVKNLYMLCFTKEGIYIGYREAELIGEKETVFAPHDGLQCQGRELFMGSVPGRTAHIHFVGNVTESNIPGNAQIGSNENTIMHSAKTSVNATDNKRVTYWGYHCEESSEKMREWLAVLNTETQEYEKIPGHNVHLVRDRARVQFRYMFDFTHANSQTVVLDGETYNLEKNPTDYTIESIDWILSNGLNQGYIAPYCLSSEDHFDAYIDFSQNPARLKKDRLTAYDRADASRYTAAESDLVRIYTRPTESGKQPYEGTVDNPLFLFEDINNASNPPRIILKVVYTATVNGSSVSKTKYHVLMLLNEEKQPRTVYRNHNYILDIYGLPWEGIGYSSFED
ncbi:MAG: hypothetical protein IJ636_00040, partial [Bacteroidales bacterium]|nr:hypothetical protein [Bacteroidales bacterium]